MPDVQKIRLRTRKHPQPPERHIRGRTSRGDLHRRRQHLPPPTNPLRQQSNQADPKASPGKGRAVHGSERGIERSHVRDTYDERYADCIPAEFRRVELGSVSY